MYTVVAIGPTPPEIENTRGAKEPYHVRFLSTFLHTHASSLVSSFIL